MRKKVQPLFSGRTIKVFGRKALSSMFSRILRSKKKSKVVRHRNNPKLEVTDRRRDTRGSIDSQVEHLWHASENPPRMGQLLRSTVRATKDEDIQRAKEERNTRNLTIVEWLKRPGYNLFVAWLKQIEGDSYYKLRHGEGRPANESLEHYLGKQDGRLEVIEDIRMMFSESRREFRDYIEAKKAEEESKKQ